jgi:quercetin 2,3-dioxygenase
MPNIIISQSPLQAMHWPTMDPFLFCAYHKDAYPKGNPSMGLDNALLAGRTPGQDFSGKDGFSMYHGQGQGQNAPGFPAHPHRGFETVTIVRQGRIDHSDSLGATARFGGGDVQWLTAGRGIVHCEMFPMLREDAGNPLELFQIWLNLPAAHKMCEPHFTMFWAEQMPRTQMRDARGREAEIAVIAGQFAQAPGAPHAKQQGLQPLAAPPHSWAARPDADVAIWTLRLQSGAQLTLPPAQHPQSQRVLYVFGGAPLTVAGALVQEASALQVKAGEPLTLSAGQAEAECLLLQGRPIGEPVAQHGPFVMNTRQEIMQAFEDYQRTQFGGWPWGSSAPLHAREAGRFAKHPSGKHETPAGTEGAHAMAM